MELRTVLNRVHKLAGFICGDCRLRRAKRGDSHLEIDLLRLRPPGTRLRPLGDAPLSVRAGARPADPVRLCHAPRGLLALHTPKTEMLPWADCKQHSTRAFGRFLASWPSASRGRSGPHVRYLWGHHPSRYGDSRGEGMRPGQSGGRHCARHRRDRWQADYRYLTPVYQLNAGCRLLLWAGEERRTETPESFFTWFGTHRAAAVRVVCSDTWKAYLSRDPQSRRTGAARARSLPCRRQTRRDDRHCPRRRGPRTEKAGQTARPQAPENLSETQQPKPAYLLNLNLRTACAYLLKEDFQQFWECRSPTQANRFLRRRCRQAARSRLEPAVRAARTMHKQRPLLLNWFRCDRAHSSAAVEGLNGKAKPALRKSYGFKAYGAYEPALYHALGDLPEHDPAHRFC